MKKITLKKWLVLLTGTFLATLFLAGSILTVRAHSGLERSEPADGAQLERSPQEIRAWFEQELETEESQMALFDAQGHPVEGATGGVDLNDVEHKIMRIEIPGPLPAGAYVVNWMAVSAEDGDPTEGQFGFTVLDGGAQAIPVQRGGNNPWAWIVAGAVAALVLAFLGLGLQRFMTKDRDVISG